VDAQPLWRTCCVRLRKKLRIHSRTTPVKPKPSCNLCNRRSWSTQSKAADISRRHSNVTCLRSAAVNISDQTRNNAVSVECCRSCHGTAYDFAVRNRNHRLCCTEDIVTCGSCVMSCTSFFRASDPAIYEAPKTSITDSSRYISVACQSLQVTWLNVALEEICFEAENHTGWPWPVIGQQVV